MLIVGAGIQMMSPRVLRTVPGIVTASVFVPFGLVVGVGVAMLARGEGLLEDGRRTAGSVATA